MHMFVWLANDLPEKLKIVRIVEVLVIYSQMSNLLFFRVCFNSRHVRLRLVQLLWSHWFILEPLGVVLIDFVLSMFLPRVEADILVLFFGRFFSFKKTSVLRTALMLNHDAIAAAFGGACIIISDYFLHGLAGLQRCGRRCRSRWLNYLRPGLKHGNFTPAEERIICEMYSKRGSR